MKAMIKNLFLITIPVSIFLFLLLEIIVRISFEYIEYYDNPITESEISDYNIPQDLLMWLDILVIWLDFISQKNILQEMIAIIQVGVFDYLSCSAMSMGFVSFKV